MSDIREWPITTPLAGSIHTCSPAMLKQDRWCKLSELCSDIIKWAKECAAVVGTLLYRRVATADVLGGGGWGGGEISVGGGGGGVAGENMPNPSGVFRLTYHVPCCESCGQKGLQAGAQCRWSSGQSPGVSSRHCCRPEVTMRRAKCRWSSGQSPGVSSRHCCPPEATLYRA